jgi:YVTN family beta-propeller protein
MRKSLSVVTGLLLTTAIFVAIAFLGAQEVIEPFYVGARVCGGCHNGPEMGHQYSLWLLSRHARAYVDLSKPEAWKIAELSGVRENPQESPLCLGCHATAADTEAWERDSTFFFEDGVQCERCHGPGGEYMPAEIMQNPEEAMRRGLVKPTKKHCMVCHSEKGSHVAVLQRPLMNIDELWQEIAHPTPATPGNPSGVLSAETDRDPTREPLFVGAQTCGKCHRGPERGYQYDHWRQSEHAHAWARLATPEAQRIAQEMGVSGDPQQAPECLRCHATGGGDLSRSTATFTIAEGIGCEACHGPGSLYQEEAVMRDPVAAATAGLQMPSRDSCLTCHNQAHGKPFDAQTAWNEVAHPNHPRETVARIQYKNPVNLALNPSGRELYVACESSDSVIVIDVEERRKVAEIMVGRQPHDIAFSPDGRLAWVTNRMDDTISEIDTAARQVLRTAPVGDEPHGILPDRGADRLYILNTGEESISVLAGDTLVEETRLTTSRYPWSLALSPDGKHFAITNSLPRFGKFRTPSISEVTIVDAVEAKVVNRLEVPGTNLLMGVAWHPSGEYAVFTLNRTKNLVPMTRIVQGWTITNGLGIAWRNGRVDQVLLDHPDLYFPDPTDVTVTPDGRFALVTSATSDRVAVVNLERLVGALESASEYERTEVIPNHVGRPTEWVTVHVETGISPRGVLVAPDGQTAFVANCLDDTVSVIDITSWKAVEQIDLGGPKEVTMARWGERLFHSASGTVRRQFSCHTCHPDGHVDGITYDTEPDGVGILPVDNRSLRSVMDTAPFKWEGTNPSLRRQCGARLAAFFTRAQPYTREELEALEYYIATIPRPPNRYRALGAPLTAAQRRGKAIFGRTHRKDGSLIPEKNRCITCHPPPLYTDRQPVDVGTKMQYDSTGVFDPPHLNNIYDSAPYLHNGIAPTLEEIWTVYNPHDTHGVTNDLTKDELNDLIEYIKTF